MDARPNPRDDPPRVAALRSFGILDTPRERDFDDLCRLAADLCATPIATINFIDDRRQWLKSEVGLDGVRELPLDNALCWETIHGTDDFLVVPDTLADPRFVHNPFCTEGLKLRFYAGAVIRTADGLPLGTLCALDRQPRPGGLDPTQLQALRTLARQIMAMLAQRRAADEARRLAAMRGLVSVQLASAAPLPLILQNCAQLLVEFVAGSFARVWTLDPGADTLVLRASAGLYTHLDGPHGRVPVGAFKIGRIARDRQPLLTNDVPHDPNISDPAWAAREGMVAFAGYPLLVEGRVAGVVAVFWRHTVSAAVLEDLAPIADGLAQCIERKGVEETLSRREQLARFLAQASADLAQVLDHQSTLQKIASTSVPAFADWCMVDLQDAEGRLQRLAVAHVDPAKERLVHRMRRDFPPTLDDAHGVGAVLRTGEPEWVEDVADPLLTAMARDPEHLRVLRELAPRSFLCVPISWRGHTLGAVTYILSESGRRYGPLDLQAAADLARRAGVAMENAQLYQELQDADRRKDEFLATLAHELRNPLAPLRNALTLLKATGNDEKTLGETRDMMDRQLQQMVRLVDDLLDVSRITRNRIELRKEPVRLDEMVRNALEISRELIDHAGHVLEVRLPAAPLWLYADPTRLAQIFSNLLNNAAKYTPDGGRLALVAERVTADGRLVAADREETGAGWVRVLVTDSGLGIETRMLTRIFDLFTQVDSSLERAQGGLGIGLSLVRRLVEMHGGRIEARSAGRGHGSEFVVDLPTAAAPPDAAARPATRTATAAAQEARAGGSAAAGTTAAAALAALSAWESPLPGQATAGDSLPGQTAGGGERTAGGGPSAGQAVAAGGGQLLDRGGAAGGGPLLDRGGAAGGGPLLGRGEAAAGLPAPPALRILVVDDNRDAATTLTKLLRRRGHEVQTVFDGEAAVAAAVEFDPEVVLLDIGLPKLNGYEAAERIRRQSARGDLVLIALTGWAQEEDRRRAKAAGFTHHLVKPVVFEELVSLLALERR